MARHELDFQLDYSIVLEEMQQTLMGRVDRFCTFGQLVLGCAVLASALPAVVTGLPIAIFAGAQIVYQPAARAMEAKLQRDRYLKLKNEAKYLNDDELEAALINILSSDSFVLGSLVHPAYLATTLALGREFRDDTRPMTKLEKRCAFWAGNLPMGKKIDALSS